MAHLSRTRANREALILWSCVRNTFVESFILRSLVQAMVDIGEMGGEVKGDGGGGGRGKRCRTPLGLNLKTCNFRIILNQ